MPAKFLNGIDLASQRIVNVASPSSAADAANKSYVDNLLGGLAWKNEVRAATTANGTLASAFDDTSVIDGITLATGDRILVKNQTDPIENGIYVVAASGAPVRAYDADAAGDLNNATVSVTSGTVNEGLTYTQNEIGPVPGTDANNWVLVASGISYTADDGLQLIGSAFSILLDSNSGLIVGGSGLAIDPDIAGSGLVWTTGVLSVDASTFVRKFAASIGNGSNTTITVTHNLGTRDVQVQLYETGSPYAQVYADVVAATTNTAEITFAAAPTSSQYRAVVHA